MTQTAHFSSDDIYQRIVDAISGAGRLTPALLDYIDTTLFPPEPERLSAFLKDADNGDRDSLLDLIFYPDVAFQIRLEPLLADISHADEHARRVYDRLLADPLEALIRMPDGTPLGVVRLPDFIKSQYLERLRLDWEMDAAVASAVEDGVAGERIPMVRVRLRNSGLRMNDDRRRFLCRFFERMPDAEPDYPACLDLMLSLIGGLGDGDDAYAHLVDHKRSLFRSLQQARRFEALQRTTNMETLMLQGVRAPHASCEALLDEMRLIDRVCHRVFGRTEPLELPMEEPLRQVTDLDDPAAAVRSLWR